MGEWNLSMPIRHNWVWHHGEVSCWVRMRHVSLLPAKVQYREKMAHKWLSEGDVITHRLKHYHMLLDGSQNLLGVMVSSIRPGACSSKADRKADSNKKKTGNSLMSGKEQCDLTLVVYKSRNEAPWKIWTKVSLDTEDVSEGSSSSLNETVSSGFTNMWITEKHDPVRTGQQTYFILCFVSYTVYYVQYIRMMYFQLFGILL